MSEQASNDVKSMINRVYNRATGVMNKALAEMLTLHKIGVGLSGYAIYEWMFGGYLLSSRLPTSQITSWPTLDDLLTTPKLNLLNTAAQTVLAIMITWAIVSFPVYLYHRQMFKPTKQLMERWAKKKEMEQEVKQEAKQEMTQIEEREKVRRSAVT